ncbi:hypothetical protein J3R30DRAFT_2175092 [Lentinula aciculospora]|uniref:Uncharacterized protein n=1 Tax=Lentinula aciculospora TaxID=153920 RepID=A0A9W9AGX3_9AGAR|nr:hypothetical protein J3R30DRAFT_2175092 [Lentinula aciculospora]
MTRIVFGLTLYPTVPDLRSRDASFIITRIFADGLIYYSVNFAVNAILTVMILAAPAGIKNIAAQSVPSHFYLYWRINVNDVVYD